jgi:hypothetical protein
MARPLSCPVCRISLPAGGTHCPRCRLRIAPLERRPKNRDLAAALEAAGDSGGVPGTAPLSMRAALLLGLAGGLLLTGVAAVIALVVTRGHTDAAAMSNSAFFTGGVTMTLAVVLGGVRVSRLLGDVELMKQRARGGGLRAAHDHVRLGFGTAAALPLLLAIALAAAAH